jgi:hypothetical protein
LAVAERHGDHVNDQTNVHRRTLSATPQISDLDRDCAADLGFVETPSRRSARARRGCGLDEALRSARRGIYVMAAKHALSINEQPRNSCS